MRKDGIPYVKNEPNYYPPIDYKKLNLEELKKKYIDTCGKSGGLLSNCSRCQTPCEYGKRAIQLRAGEVYDDPVVPLYGGKTLIERAKEENMLRRKKMEEEEKKKAEEKSTPKCKRGVRDPEGWYEEAMASEDPVEYVVKRFELSKTKAKKKIYSYRYLHGITDKTGKTSVLRKTEEPEEPIVSTVKEVTEESAIETKMEALMKLQEKYKNIMLEMKQKYEKAKQDYEDVGKKIDILCNAMDIMNE
jgi:hypothetical protein